MARGTVCQGCGEVRGRADARFCPTCGGAVGGAGDTARPDRLRRCRALLGLVTTLLVVTVVVTVGDRLPTARPSATPETPEDGGTAPRNSVGEGATDVDAEVTLPARGADGGTTTCAPHGCELWRTEVGDGRLWPIGERLYHVGGDRLRRLDPATGERLVERVSEAAGPQARLRSQPLIGDELGAADEVLLLQDGRVLEARDALDGELRWTAGFDATAAGAFVVARGVAVVASHPARASDADPAPPVVRAHDLRNGEPRWQRKGWLVATSGPLLVAAADGDGRVEVLDPASGEPLATVAEGDLRGVASGVLAVRADDTVEVLAWPSLELVHRHELGPGRDAQLLGPFLLVDAAEQLAVGEAAPGAAAERATSRVGETSEARYGGGFEATAPAQLRRRGEGAAASGVAELRRPAIGDRLTRLDEGFVDAVTLPGEAGTVIVHHRDGTLLATGHGMTRRERWRTEVPLAPVEAEQLDVLAGPSGVVGIGTRVDERMSGRELYLDGRTGVPATRGPGVGAPPERFRLGATEVVIGEDGVRLHGPDGEVRFDGVVEVVHPGDPLLVRDGDDLVAIDERLLDTGATDGAGDGEHGQ